MAFTPEDGSVVAGANAYTTVEFVDDYHADRGIDEWGGPVADKQQAVIRATDYIDRTYEFLGLLKDPETPQDLQWPRSRVVTRESVLLDEDVVPVEVQRATAELALVALTECEPLQPRFVQRSVSRRREQAGDVQLDEEYAGLEHDTSFPSVDLILRPLIVGRRQAGGNVPLVRA